MRFRTQPPAAPPDTQRMCWWTLGIGHGVLELPGPRALELELLVWWGGGVATRAAWVWSQTGKVAIWAHVGQA
jgi:hypothetical protein